jgi:hypothetical protein
VIFQLYVHGESAEWHFSVPLISFELGRHIYVPTHFLGALNKNGNFTFSKSDKKYICNFFSDAEPWLHLLLCLVR